MGKLFLQLPLLSPEDNATGSLSDSEFINEDIKDDTTEDNTDDTTDDSTDDTDTDSNNDDNQDDDDQDDVDEDDEQDQDEDDDENEEEDKDPAQEATFKNIKAKYPELFKEFPALEKSFGIAKQYEAVFASPKEAQEAAVRLDSIDRVLGDLEIGNPLSLLTDLAQNKPAFTKFATNLLPTLFKVDQDAFYEASLPVISAALKNAVKEANKNPELPYNKNLLLATKYISKFVFDDENIPDFRNQNRNEVDPEKAKLIKERDEFIQAKYGEYTQDINSTVESELKRAIGAELKSIKGLNLNDYSRKKAVDDIFKAIDVDMNNDTQFVSSIRSLLNKASKSGFTDKALSSRIKATFLERGKGRVSKLTQKVLRAEKLITSNNGVKRNLRDAGNGNRSQNKTRNINPSAVDYRSTSDLDILNDNVKTRK